MPNGKRMAALSIGVSDARPLPFLAGAVNGARAFHEWATALGYEARLLTDEEEPVTFTRLRAELDTTLADTSTPIHRLVIYFAGHGLIREAEEGLWLLSDWNKELRAVAVEPLRRRLYLYGIRQIALFADACRDLPPDVAASDLTPDAVLGRGPVRQGRPPAIDKFIAAQDGNATFMVPGPTP
ncbi:MAG: caspase family protein, partial [Vicinamibacterales bacterium]